MGKGKGREQRLKRRNKVKTDWCELKADDPEEEVDVEDLGEVADHGDTAEGLSPAAGAGHAQSRVG